MTKKGKTIQSESAAGCIIGVLILGVLIGIVAIGLGITALLFPLVLIPIWLYCPKWRIYIKVAISAVVVVVWALILPHCLLYFDWLSTGISSSDYAVHDSRGVLPDTEIAVSDTTPTPLPLLTPAPTQIPTIRKGMTGTAVVEIQTALNALGYLNYEPDGIFGTPTEAALKAFQRKNGLFVDGIAGPHTLTLLFSGSALRATDVYSASLNGRGMSDSGRSEPQYVGQRGYVSFYGTFTHNPEGDNCYDTPWMIPTYTRDKQFYVESGTVAHKTEIIVLAQELQHEGYGAYSGMLLVRCLDNGDEFYINVMNFITKPYWTYTDLMKAVSEGYFLAVFHQQSDYYPVGTNNSRINLTNGTLVLVKRATGLHGRKGPDKDTHPIEGMVFQDWQYGYGGVTVYFAIEDLSIIY